jgi:lipopolysaccharide/colanic/teichoic acid biosynthesis glycosyltransferase
VLLKRAIDIVGSGLALLVGFPLLMAIAAAVAIDSGFPVLYRQRRVGRGFRLFYLWKFRSMSASEGGPRITVSGDSRVTRVGRFLRAAKLDELPQFWNVLTGEMSLVGPRPEIPEYVAMFAGRYRDILTVRPGITDLASVQFRDEEDVLARAPDPIEYYGRHVLPAKLELAEEYLRKRSLLFDLSILLRTFRAVFGIGAATPDRGNQPPSSEDSRRHVEA